MNFAKILQQKHNVKHTSLIFGQEASVKKTQLKQLKHTANLKQLQSFQADNIQLHLVFFQLCLFLAPPARIDFLDEKQEIKL